ncbi:MAG: RluA family pseudouridine synthase [Patescibacteria group bacterium]
MKIYESDKILVVNKPSGKIVSDLAEELKEEVKELKDLPRYGLAHRIDKNTSGLLLLAKTKEVLKDLQRQFKEREINKKYTCLVWRKMKDPEGKIVTSMKRGGDRRKHQSYSPEKEGRRAVSFYKVLDFFENYSLIEVKPITGRRHQIRSQFAYLGHPLVGDDLYGFKDQQDPVEMNRHFLHSTFLEFKVEGKTKRFESVLPEDLQEIINKLKENV